MDYAIIDFNVHGDHDGKLVAIEKSDIVPFDIKRVYYIYDTKCSVVRGKHAHKDLQQVVICMKGSCDFILDDGTTKEVVHLNNPAKGLYIKNKIWREFTNFSSDCVIVVLASNKYDPNDYIKDYNDFILSII